MNIANKIKNSIKTLVYGKSTGGGQVGTNSPKANKSGGAKSVIDAYEELDIYNAWTQAKSMRAVWAILPVVIFIVSVLFTAYFIVLSVTEIVLLFISSGLKAAILFEITILHVLRAFLGVFLILLHLSVAVLSIGTSVCFVKLMWVSIYLYSKNSFIGWQFALICLFFISGSSLIMYSTSYIGGSFTDTNFSGNSANLPKTYTASGEYEDRVKKLVLESIATKSITGNAKAQTASASGLITPFVDATNKKSNVKVYTVTESNKEEEVSGYLSMQWGVDPFEINKSAGLPASGGTMPVGTKIVYNPETGIINVSYPKQTK